MGQPEAKNEQAVPEKSADDKLLDELMEKPVQKEAKAQENPTTAKMEKSPPCEPTSRSKSRPAKGASDTPKKSSQQRTSVRQDLREIQAQRKQEAELPKREEKAAPEKKAAQKTTQHKQPSTKKKPKSKERG